MENINSFNSVLYAVSDRIRPVLESLSPCVKANTSEIRLRIGLPLALTVNGETVFVKASGQTQFNFSGDLFKVIKEDLTESFKRLCNNSVYAHEKELENGYIVMKNGCRAGVCGTLNADGFLTDITSVNLRIARQVFGCANDIIKHYSSGGLLIAGPPCSGKTTVLRDLVRQLANGNSGKIKKVSVIDSRREISGGNTNNGFLDLGIASDVLLCEDKAKGIEIALRTMFPDVIAFDEIGTVAELKSVSDSFCSGVDIITTAHIGALDELLSRSVTYELLKSGAIDLVALLPRLHGNTIKLITVKELLCERAV